MGSLISTSGTPTPLENPSGKSAIFLGIKDSIPDEDAKFLNSLLSDAK